MQGTLRLNNAAPANLTVTLVDKAGNTTAATNGLPMLFVPLFDWAIGRRPYVYEDVGAVIFKHDAGVAGQRLQISGVLKPHWDGNVSAPVPAHGRAHVGGPIPLFDTHLTLGGPGAVNFSLAALPASVFMNLVITITLPNTGGTITRWKLFQRAPPPPTVRVPSRPMSPPRGSIRFRLALRTYAPWGCIVHGANVWCLTA